MAGPNSMPIPKMVIPVPIFSAGQASMRRAWPVDMSPPPANPCRMRNAINWPRLVAVPHRSEKTVNSAMEARKYRLRPKRLPSHPEMGRTITLARM